MNHESPRSHASFLQSNSNLAWAIGLLILSIFGAIIPVIGITFIVVAAVMINTAEKNRDTSTKRATAVILLIGSLILQLSAGLFWYDHWQDQNVIREQAVVEQEERKQLNAQRAAQLEQLRLSEQQRLLTECLSNVDSAIKNSTANQPSTSYQDSAIILSIREQEQANCRAKYPVH